MKIVFLMMNPLISTTEKKGSDMTLKEKLEDIRMRSKSSEYWLGSWNSQIEKLAKEDAALFEDAA